MTSFPFLEEWFGFHAGREVLTGTAPHFSRDFIEKPEQLASYVQERDASKRPSYMSVQPFSERNQPFGLEKLFFDFDCEEDIIKAWKEAHKFAETLIQYYRIMPFLTFSGGKGYHVYTFLTETVSFREWNLKRAKRVYETLQRKLLKGLEFETLDSAVLGDIKRLARVPFSRHQKTGKTCSPITLSHQFYEPQSLTVFRECGLDTSLLEPVCKELKAEEKLKKVLSKNVRKFSSEKIHEIRPCITAALSQDLRGHRNSHLMRLAIAVEHLHKGVSPSQVVELFRGQADFDEDKSRYFVEDAQRKGYKPFKCKTIQKLGFCLKEKCPIWSGKHGH